MSWLFSQALVEEFSAVTCSDGEPSVQLNVMPTPHRFSYRGKTMEHSDLSRFGLTCAVLTEDHGTALLTSFLAGFPARTSAALARAPASTESDRDYGQKWRASWAKFDRGTSSWKTAQCSLLGDSEGFLETWPRWGSMRDGVSYLRPMSTLPTFGNASGSSPIYPTPCTVDTGSFFNRSASPNAKKRPTLGAMAKHNLWPTPTSGNDHSGGRLDEWGGSRSRAKMRELVSPKELTGPLSPTFPEWLMGWPIDWTALKPLETDKFREWQQQHGKS